MEFHSLYEDVSKMEKKKKNEVGSPEELVQ